jgi:hypothetical protein
VYIDCGPYVAYDIIMNQSQLLRMLFRPSLISCVGMVTGAGIVLAVMNWSRFHAQPFFEIYFSGEYGLWSVLRSLNVFLGQAADSIVAYNVAVICFSALVGLTLYLVVESVHHMAGTAHLHAKGITFGHGREVSLRLGLRLICITVWLGYIVLFVKVIVPFCNWLVNGTVRPLGPELLYGTLAFTVLCAAFHVHVLCLRLLVLRPRVF